MQLVVVSVSACTCTHENVGRLLEWNGVESVATAGVFQMGWEEGKLKNQEKNVREGRETGEKSRQAGSQIKEDECAQRRIL